MKEQGKNMVIKNSSYSNNLMQNILNDKIEFNELFDKMCVAVAKVGQS